MEDCKDFNPDDLLDRAVDAVLRDPIGDELPPDRVARLAAVARQAADQPYPITLITRIKNMKPMTRIAVAATVLIAFLGLMSWLAPDGGVALAFDDVAEAIANVHSATWKFTHVVKKPDGKTYTTKGIGMFLAPAYERVELTAKGKSEIAIFDGETSKVLGLLPLEKQATIIDIKNLPPDAPIGRRFVGWQNTIRNAQRGEGGKVERLGAETVEGRRAEGFRVTCGSIALNLWADPKTMLPVHIESWLSGRGGDSRTVYTDFQINVPLDRSLFSLDVPAGYKIQSLEIDTAKPPVQHMVAVLKLAAEHNGGVFPRVLLGKDGLKDIINRMGKEHLVRYGRDSTEFAKIRAEVGVSMGAAFGMLYALPKDAWHYAGKDVKLGTPDRPIFWFKSRRNPKWQVIYADLTIKQLSAEEVKNLP